MNYSKVGTIEGIFLICIGILNHAILYLPKSIFNVCGNASILNTIYISVILLIFLIIFIKLYKPFYGQDILDISKYLGGNILKVLTGLLFIAFYFIMTSIMLRNFAEGVNLAYFSQVNIKVVLCIFILGVYIGNKFGKSSIIKCNTIIFFFMIISFTLLIVSVVPNIELNRVFPIWGNGINSVFVQGIGNLYVFSGISIIFFISPMLRNPESLNKIVLISYCIISVILFLIVAVLLLALNFLLEVTELSPIYLLVKSVNFGKFFQNPESIFILVWILSIISFLCVFSMLIITIMQKLLNLQDSTALSGLIANLTFIFTLIPRNFSDIIFVVSNLYKWFQILLVFVYSFIVLGIAYFKKTKKSISKEVLNE